MIKHLSVCPICGKNAKQVGSWVQCPKFRKTVCMEHCESCRSFSGYEQSSVVHCFFGNKLK